MLISDFARAAGLPTETVRFYIRRGLLHPKTGAKGGANPYQIFTSEDVETVRIIRLAQSLGFSLREIAVLGEEYRSGTITPERSIAIMTEQLDRLDEKARQLDAMTRYLRAKIDWLQGGEAGLEPCLSGDVAVMSCSSQAGNGKTGPRRRRRGARLEAQ